MPTVMTRAERQQRTRDELVDAAERLFSRQGFHATSIDAVAAEAGFTKGAVYSNFASKEDLFFAVYERRVDRRVEEMETALARGLRPCVEAFERMAPGRRGAARARRRLAGGLLRVLGARAAPSRAASSASPPSTGG